VDLEGYVALHTNRYSGPVDWIGRRVEVRETKDKIEIRAGAADGGNVTYLARLFDAGAYLSLAQVLCVLSLLAGADPKGLPLDRDGITTPGNVSSSVVLARIPKGGRSIRLIPPRVKTSTFPATVGKTSKQYDYIFTTKLPADYQKNATHSVGVYESRNLSEFDLGL
jgi:hypothetical protein